MKQLKVKRLECQQVKAVDIPVEPLADEAPVYILEGEEKNYNTSKNDYTHIDA